MALGARDSQPFLSETIQATAGVRVAAPIGRYADLADASEVVDDPTRNRPQAPADSEAMERSVGELDAHPFAPIGHDPVGFSAAHTASPGCGWPYATDPGCMARARHRLHRACRDDVEMQMGFRKR